ncbi:MAG: peptidylprolyl isomerase [Salinibacter sp.]
MNKLRENTGVILWILVISFGVIWTLQDSEVFDAVNQPGQNVATVNGEAISNQEFQNAVQQQRQRAQEESDGQITAQMDEQIREQAYEQLINSQLLEMEMKRLGISVTDSEVEEMVFGENPHPLIRQQFADSSGQINYQMLENMAQNPEAEQQWIQLEQYLREQRRQQKMNSLVQSTVFVSEEDIKRYHWRQNVQSDVEYAALRYASVPSDSVRVSESDLRDYYDENREDFKQEKTVTLEYVSLPKLPTAEDTAAVRKDLESLRDEFASTEDDSLFLADNASAQSFSSAYATPDEMDATVAEAVYENPEPGRMAGPVFGNDLAHLIKIRDVQSANETFVQARHILLETEEADPEAASELEALRDSIRNGASFSRLAQRHSDGPSASEGGALGWFGRGQMADAFEDAAFDAQPGDLVGPVRSEFGYHLIEVQNRTDQAVQIADLAFELSPSRATLSDIENTLDDVAFYASEDGSFQEEAERRDLDVEEVQAEATQSSVPGLGSGSGLTNFLESAEEGDISEVIDLSDSYAVVKASRVQPEGYRSFEDVQSEIRPRVELQKKKQVQLRRMRQALEQNDFTELPEALGTELRSESGISFSTESVPGIGDDPTFAGTVFGLDEGETSRVVEGKNAAFVVRVTDMQEPEALTDQERQKIRKALLQEQQRQISSQWIAALKEDARIEDNRGQFQ